MRQPSSSTQTPATVAAIPAEPHEWLYSVLATLVSPAHMAELRNVRDEHPWTAVVRRSWTTDDAVLAALALRFRMRTADVMHVAPSALEAVREAVARRFHVLPLTISDSTIEMATSNPQDVECERALTFIVGREVRMLLAPPHRIAERTDELYRPERVIERIIAQDFKGVDDVVPISEASADDSELSIRSAADRPIIRLVDRIVAKAIRFRASDVHLEPDEHGVTVRYRIDGVLKPDSVIPRAISAALVARVKIMAQLDIADRLRPQDGRARVAVGGARVDLRVSTLPASLGEKVVIRILDARQTVLALDALGFDDDDLTQVHALLQAREGLIIVTGPTGSGKTTTLYSIVRQVQQRGVNIVTVEDPVEYRLRGIVQVQINDKTGLTFPAALRSILRQDPDVILIGEIRDRETAQIAVQAALTGHLVLSTLHTADAASAVTRLSDLGIDAYKTAAALRGVVAQRLLRRLCADCRVLHTAAIAASIRMYILGPARVYQAAGCLVCSNTGYLGRLAICEVLSADAEVEREISANAPPERVARAARAAGMRTLWQSATRQVGEGRTSIEELLRVFETPPADDARHANAMTQWNTPRAARRAAGKPPDADIGHDVAPNAWFDARAFTGAAFDLLDEYRDHSHARCSVLLVANDTTTRRAVRDALEADAVLVHEARNGSEALDRIDRYAPEAVVLDFGLPDFDGHGLLRNIRARAATRNLPVLVLAPALDEDAELRALALGADACIATPFRQHLLAARIHALVGRARQRAVGAESGVNTPGGAR